MENHCRSVEVALHISDDVTCQHKHRPGISDDSINLTLTSRIVLFKHMRDER